LQTAIYKEILKHPLFKILIGIIIISILGAAFVLFFEYHSNDQLKSAGDALWWVLVTMTTVGYGDRVPITPGGRVIGVAVMFLGVALVSLFTATISSIFVARQIKEGRGLEQIKFKNHLIICGWNFNGQQILKSLVKSKNKSQQIVLINQLSEEAVGEIISTFSDLIIKFVYGDYTKELILNRANTRFASSVIILPDASVALAEKSDERTILATLSIKAINSKIKVYAHIINRENLSHIKKAKADEVLVSDAYSGYLLAAHVLEPGIPQVVDQLFSEDSPYELVRINSGPSLINMTVRDLRKHFIEKDGSLLLGIGRETQGMNVIDILSDDYSYLDEFIKRKFEESGRGLSNEGGIKINLNPDENTILQERDFIIVLKSGEKVGNKH